MQQLPKGKEYSFTHKCSLQLYEVKHDLKQSVAAGPHAAEAMQRGRLALIFSSHCESFRSNHSLKFPTSLQLSEQTLVGGHQGPAAHSQTQTTK